MPESLGPLCALPPQAATNAAPATTTKGARKARRFFGMPFRRRVREGARDEGFGGDRLCHFSVPAIGNRR
jgi:hypothetical protein